MDGWTHDRHNAMTIARWPLTSGAKNQLNTLFRMYEGVKLGQRKTLVYYCEYYDSPC